MRKKLPLTGIAVLLLSAGAVQAREDQWLERWQAEVDVELCAPSPGASPQIPALFAARLPRSPRRRNDAIKIVFELGYGVLRSSNKK
jgi:hypothetical protein